ncbi:MAG TPA: hypothetical protein VLE97_06320 [Gaiellaceae bacterium]|nr:hypothetical protein [Gaiellaceae bacterium]
MMAVDFPPPGLAIIEQTDDRIVQLRKAGDGFSIDVWLKSVVFVGWYCSPDAGVSLTSDGAARLRAALPEVA